MWLGEEWFCPAGIPGFAVPFYLAHPRLMRLERKMMLEAEGSNLSWCMKLLRHETGHAIQNAFRLHQRRLWQRMFGKSSQAYPKSYQPNPSSRSYVLNLYLWYAQSHPDEDFAETFGSG
ncbi:MAG: putative zinc-binding metallopeptidase [Myxococcota bacterium]